MGNIQIGKYTLKHGLFLAPLAGVSDRAFREVCRAHGAEYTVSEMVSAKALCYEQKSKKAVRTAPLASVYQKEMPMAIQLFGREPEFLAEAARMIEAQSYNGCESNTPPAAIDINMGCPVHKVVSNGEGSALMKEPKRAAEIVRAVRAAVTIPVTVKIRTGWDHASKNAVEMAKHLEDAGATLIAVHGRTREDMYAPGVDIESIARVKQSVSVPVVANGDIYSAADAEHMLAQTGCDGIMIARGALGNPFLFAEIRAALEGTDYKEPSWQERFDTALGQVERMIEEKGERIAIAEARKHLSWYIKGARGAASARVDINRATTLEDMKHILDQLI
ncbi:MAG: tRNA dihydrouridine synthase DusB [Clostridia bacterium]|nr:tRNA dihydrouridine synthase DusB [Clostridia bacterium]